MTHYRELDAVTFTGDVVCCRVGSFCIHVNCAAGFCCRLKGISFA